MQELASVVVGSGFNGRQQRHGFVDQRMQGQQPPGAQQVAQAFLGHIPAQQGLLALALARPGDAYRAAARCIP